MTAFTGHEPVLFTIGDLGITEHWIITPAGAVPIAGSRWHGTPVVTTTRTTPGWAIAGAIVFFVACFLGLLFLLVKTTRTSGYYDVQVEAVGLQHSIRLPVWDLGQVTQCDALVAHARQLAWMASQGVGF